MEINLFTCTAETNRLDKNNFISNRFVLSGTMKNSTSVIDPVIIIEKTNPAKYGYNYMYIPEFNRWYFINDIITISDTVWEIHAHVDVLYSWIGDIKTTECIAEKIEDFYGGNVYYDDGSFITDCRKDIQVIEFPSGLNENGSYILICAGGV